jgi:hypothetical protein
VAEPGIDKQLMSTTASTIITQKPTVASQKIAARRTRDSVRRASDFVQIAIALIGSGQANFLLSAMAWFQQVLEKNGGDDETRTRDLCRDSAAGIGFTTTYNNAGTAKIPVSRTRHRILWVGLWVGNLPSPATKKISHFRIWTSSRFIG